MQPFLLLCHSN